MEERVTAKVPTLVVPKLPFHSISCCSAIAGGEQTGDNHDGVEDIEASAPPAANRKRAAMSAQPSPVEPDVDDDIDEQPVEVMFCNAFHRRRRRK